MTQEIAVISGKGGTGKTSLAASFAILAKTSVVADCDVDAADLHLLLAPHVRQTHDFFSGHEAVILHDKCTACGLCEQYCRFHAIRQAPLSNAKIVFSVDPISCEGCGVCVRFCPANAIEFPEQLCGQWMVSETRCGPMVHAQLKVAAENSGKLVSVVRREARKLAQSNDRSHIIVDGPPGIGCPVIASITGTSRIIVVTEPTISGEHDLERVLTLARHFQIPAGICVNKSDINLEMTSHIEEKATQEKVKVLGRIRYDESVTTAQLQGLTPVETDSPAAKDITQIWDHILDWESNHGNT